MSSEDLRDGDTGGCFTANGNYRADCIHIKVCKYAWYKGEPDCSKDCKDFIPTVNTEGGR